MIGDSDSPLAAVGLGAPLVELVDVDELLVELAGTGAAVDVDAGIGRSLPGASVPGAVAGAGGAEEAVGD